MKISELVAVLSGSLEKYGDLDVYMSSDDEGNRIRNVSEASALLRDSEDYDGDEKYDFLIWPGYTDYYEHL